MLISLGQCIIAGNSQTIFEMENKMNTEEIISGLKQEADFSEVYQKTSFHCIRTDKNCSRQEVEVNILDAGPDVNQSFRYFCIAKSEDGKIATGNPDSSIELVLMHVHWHNLDR